MPRAFAVLLALVLGAPALAQPSAPRQVELLAPQLVDFAGSRENFESLVNGLTLGTPVTLTSAERAGMLEIATFAPGTTLTPVQAAQALESARQSLIARGIVRPRAGLLAASIAADNVPIQIRSERARRAALSLPAGGDLDRVLRVRHFSPHHVQSLHRRLGLPGTLTTFEAAQALQLANFHLALQGILEPTPAELRAALFGGSVLRGTVPIRGVLEGRRFNTSHSPYFGTSDTPNLQPIVSPPPVVPKVPLLRVERGAQPRR